jgi:hypothetical protein
VKSTETLRKRLDAARVHAAGSIRRMAIIATTKVLWKLRGMRLLDGSREEPEVEVFGGIGIYARPPASGKPEAIVVLLGDDGTAPVAVAVRDERTRAAVAGAIEPDETALYNSTALVHIKADETIEARSKNGVAVPLLPAAEMGRFMTALDAAIAAQAANPAGQAALQALKTALQALIPAWPAGTSKLKGE